MYRRLLVAVDESETSAYALQHALTLAQSLKAEVMLVHVVEEVVLSVGEEIVDPRLLWDAMTHGGQALLDRYAQQAQALGIPISTRLHQLRALNQTLAESIIQIAQDWQADLLVLGTHGRRGWRRLMLGSTAEEVIRRAMTPVLLIRHP